MQYIDSVVEVPVDEEPGDAALTAVDSRSCCTKCYSDVETVIDIHLDGVVTIIENLADERDSTECAFVDSDTGYSWNPSVILPGTCGPQTSQTHVSRIDEQVLETSHGFESAQAAETTPGKEYLVVLINGVESLAWILVLRHV